MTFKIHEIIIKKNSLLINMVFISFILLAATFSKAQQTEIQETKAQESQTIQTNVIANILNEETMVQNIDLAINKLTNNSALGEAPPELNVILKEILLRYSETLKLVFSSNTNAAEKRIEIQKLIESFEKALINNSKNISTYLKDVDVEALESKLAKESNLDKFINKDMQKLLVKTLSMLKQGSGYQDEFEKHISIVTRVIKDVIDIWGTDVYLSLSNDPAEKERDIKD